MKGLMGFDWQAEWDVHSIREGGDFNDNRTVFKGVFKVNPVDRLLHAIADVLLLDSAGALPHFFADGSIEDSALLGSILFGLSDC